MHSSYDMAAHRRQVNRVHRRRNRQAILPEAVPTRRFAIVDRFGSVAGLASTPSAARLALTMGAL